MGGRGSGDWWRWDKRETTDGVPRLDVRQFQRQGKLEPGWFTAWPGGWTPLRVEVHDLGDGIPALAGRQPPVLLLVLDYRHRGAWGQQDVRQPVFLDWTPCHYGGYRPWFRCPGDGCDRRVAVLWGAGRYFLCRHCSDLAYASTREEPHQRQWRKAQAIRRRLGGGSSPSAPFPPKPARMHRRTYARLRRAGLAAELASHLGVIERLGAILDGCDTAGEADAPPL